MMTATRTARQRTIIEVLRGNAVRSQGELAALMAGQGFAVTQATLSRDLHELGAVKVRRGGHQVYAVPPEGGERQVSGVAGDARARLRRTCADLLVTAQSSENLVVLHTPPGGANLLASAIDHAQPPDVLGTIAGDDTVMVIAASAAAAPGVADHLLALADGREGDQ